jgi:hypothetical protein
VVPTSAFAFSGADSARFCEFTRTYYDRFATLFAGLGSRSDPVALGRVVEQLTGSIRDAVGVAPGEIKADVQMLAAAASGFVAALRQANFDFAKVPPSAGARLQEPDVKAARDRVDAYVRTVCRGTS